LFVWNKGGTRNFLHGGKGLQKWWILAGYGMARGAEYGLQAAIRRRVIRRGERSGGPKLTQFTRFNGQIFGPACTGLPAAIAAWLRRDGAR